MLLPIVLGRRALLSGDDIAAIVAQFIEMAG
jgi:hypothetical protein